MFVTVQKPLKILETCLSQFRNRRPNLCKFYCDNGTAFTCRCGDPRWRKMARIAELLLKLYYFIAEVPNADKKKVVGLLLAAGILSFDLFFWCFFFSDCTIANHDFSPPFVRISLEPFPRIKEATCTTTLLKRKHEIAQDGNPMPSRMSWKWKVRCYFFTAQMAMTSLNSLLEFFFHTKAHRYGMI